MQFCPTSILHGGLTRYLPILIVDRRFFHFWRNHSYQFQLLEFLFSSSSASLGTVPQTVFFPVSHHPEVLNLIREQEKCSGPFRELLGINQKSFKTLIGTGMSAIKRSKLVGTGKWQEIEFYFHSTTQYSEFTTIKIL